MIWSTNLVGEEGKWEWITGSRGRDSLSDLWREKVVVKLPGEMAKWAAQPRKVRSTSPKNYKGATDGELSRNLSNRQWN